MNEPSELSLFFGRFHPVFVHLPIGLIVLLVFLEVMAKFQRFKNANANNGLILALAAPLAVLTAFLGWLLSREGGYNTELLNIHMWTGIGTAAVLVIAAFFYRVGLAGLYKFSLFASFIILVGSSHFGGSLTHGSDYLVRHAPDPLKNLLAKKKSPRAPAQSTTGVLASLQPAPNSSPIASLSAGGEMPSGQARPIFTSLVQPVLDDKCVACHGPEKDKGGLRLDSYEALVKGGDTGPGIVAGKAAESEIIKRILLPLDDDEHMPPDGKPQPNPDDIALLQWWIDLGANPTQEVASAKLTPKITRILESRFGKAPESTSTSSAPDEVRPTPKPQSELLPVAAKLSDELEVPITALGQNEPWFQCNAGVAGPEFGDAELEKLKPLGSNLKWLDLGGTGVTDDGLKHLSAFPNLERLHLHRTKITDAGLPTIAALGSVVYLNLHTTAVTDKGLESLTPAPRLRKVYLWQSRATPKGVTALVEARTDREQIRLWEEEIERLKGKIKDQQMVVELGVTNTPVKTVAQSTNATGQAAAAKSPINKECPVSGKPIDPSRTSEYEGKLVGFCCGDCKAKFDADPKAFAGKFGR